MAEDNEEKKAPKSNLEKSLEQTDNATSANLKKLDRRRSPLKDEAPSATPEPTSLGSGDEQDLYFTPPKPNN